MSDTNNSLPEKKLTCADCPASLACVAGAVSYVLSCVDCKFAFARLRGTSSYSYEHEIKLPWGLRHECRHIQAGEREESPGVTKYPAAWYRECRCRDCQVKHILSGPVYSNPQRMLLTKEQYDDLVTSLGAPQGDMLKDISCVNTPADKAGIPAGFVGGVPVSVVPSSHMGKNEMCVVGSDGKEYAVRTTIGDKSQVFSSEELNRVLRVARGKEVAAQARLSAPDPVVAAMNAASQNIAEQQDQENVEALRGVADTFEREESDGELDD